MTLPAYVVDLESFVAWLRTQSRQLENFGTQIAEALDDLRHFEELNATTEKIFLETDIDVEKDASTETMLRAVFERYTVVRGSTSEWHDVDISAPDYAERFEALMSKSSSDDDLRYRVRRGLVKMGLITDKDSNLYAAQMLTALLGVEFG